MKPKPKPSGPALTMTSAATLALLIVLGILFFQPKPQPPQPPPPQPPTGLLTTDGHPIIEGERYYRTYWMLVARNQGDPREDDHVIRVWTSFIVTRLDPGPPAVVLDERFTPPYAYNLNEVDVWKSVQAMKEHHGGWVIPSPPTPSPKPTPEGDDDGLPDDWPNPDVP